MKGSDGVAGDSLARECRRDGGEKADRGEVGVHGEGDPRRFEGPFDAVTRGILLLQHQRQSLGFVEGRERSEACR